MNVALHWNDKGDKGDGILCRGHSFTVWHSRRSDRVNHSTCLGTGMCKRRLGDVGSRCGAKAIKALQAPRSGWEEEKSTASYGKSRLPRKALSFMALDISQQGSRCCPHKCKLNPVEIGQFLAA